MVLILLLTTVCLIQLSNGKSTEWERGQNIMTWLFIVWLLYYIMEIMNPNCVLEAWNINITPYALIPLICAFVVPVVIRTKKDIELLLLVWSAFVIIFTLKGYWQKNHGFSTKDLYFLHVLGGARTHIIWSGIRYFSCFSDAANYGHLLHLRILCRLQMEAPLFPFYSLVRYLRHGYFRNPFRYGSAHGRHADDYYHSQELESVARGNIHIYRHFRIFLLHQYRERQPVYP